VSQGISTACDVVGTGRASGAAVGQALAPALRTTHGGGLTVDCRAVTDDDGRRHNRQTGDSGGGQLIIITPQGLGLLATECEVPRSGQGRAGAASQPCTLSKLHHSPAQQRSSKNLQSY